MKMMANLLTIAVLACLVSCGGRGGAKAAEEPDPVLSVQETAVQAEPQVRDFFFDLDAEGLPVKRVLAPATNLERCFIVISKVHPEHLNVYEVQGADTLLLASYPVCVARNKGQKQVRGDNKTPESYPGEPFYISQIQDASDWHHDFGDGRGSIPAYGHWFMRLAVPGFSGIGIHGSTNNRESLKVGRGSEGCIRLLDEDIIHLHDNYARKGMEVIILPEDHGPLSFEQKALALLLRGETPRVSAPVVKEEVAEPVRVNTWPEHVTVSGDRQRLRVGPNPDTDPIFADEKGAAICPANGEILPCLGEAGPYFKVLFKGQELYINKKSVQ